MLKARRYYFDELQLFNSKTIKTQEMQAAWKKLVRDTVEQTVIRKYKQQHLNFDQYISRIRFPSIPRIVVYSQSQGVENYLEQIFPLYKFVNPAASADSDQILARTVAEQIVGAPSEEYGGYIVKGFPFNINQALLLDRYINGVNLAIHLRGQNQQKSDDSVSNLLNYYDQRGTLLRLQMQTNPTAEQLQFATRQIISNIKLSE